MSEEARRSRSSEAFFGRRRGKPVRPQQAEALRAGLAHRGLDLNRPAPADLRTLFPVSVDKVVLEIGFGGGERLRAAAVAEPRTGFIGVEPFVNSMAKMTAALAEAPLENVRLYDEDATRLLDWLPGASLAGIDLFYPDPWPKKRHWKRRFVGEANLRRFARVLEAGGMFRFASDVADYVEWTHAHLAAHPDFVAQDRDERSPYEGWPGTRYEAKALIAGRRPAYLAFRRVGQSETP